MMDKSFSTNPNLADWVPTAQQITTIEEARRLIRLVPEEQGDSTNKSVINALNVYACLNPEVTDPQKLVDGSLELLILNIAYLARSSAR